MRPFLALAVAIAYTFLDTVVRDWVWYHLRWRRPQPESLTRSDVFDLLDQQRTSRGMIRTVKALREEHLLKGGDELRQTETALRALLEATRIPDVDRSRLEALVGHNDDAREWVLSGGTRRARLLSRAGRELQDALTALLIDLGREHEGDPVAAG